MSSTIVLDLETQRAFSDVGGRAGLQALGVSLLGVYFYDTDTFYGFREKEIPEFERYVADHQPTIIGFNSLHFDVPILQPYCKNVQLARLPHVDILKDITAALGVRLKLDSVARTTLLEGKSGHGLDAIRYFRANEWDKLERYCLDDVRITRDLYEYGKQHGRILYENNGELRPIRVNWSNTPTISERLQQIANNHRQVTCTLLEFGHDGKPERIPITMDVRGVNGERVIAFLPDRHEERVIPLERIVAIHEHDTISMHQASLL
ncbi:MAG: ribonuclease H-like domain-containing protein [Candidatus Kerfeldbacteria bacterium]|nr:ribonuclease H-like domain-containing protein [Candidatus Kerfeldbacteria bacterium]